MCIWQQSSTLVDVLSGSLCIWQQARTLLDILFLVTVHLAANQSALDTRCVCAAVTGLQCTQDSKGCAGKLIGCSYLHALFS